MDGKDLPNAERIRKDEARIDRREVVDLAQAFGQAGHAGDYEQMSLEDLADWYRRWYAPNNAILVVVGDVQPEAVFEMANRHFGPIRSTSPS